MKKFLINIMLMVITLLFPSHVLALSTTQANELIDITKKASLTINYSYDDYEFNDVDVKVYNIASVTTDFQYQLSSDFTSYSIKINGIKTQNEWDALKQTLNSYIEADNIEEDYLLSIKDNKVELSDLTPGLYLVKTDKIDTDDYTLVFDSFLISVPDLKDDGTWNYDVTVISKAEEYTPKYEKITYSVIKQWKDEPKTRPESVEIEIYEDGTLVETKELSKENNWMYQWTTDDDGSTWTVVERNIKEGYEVSIQKQDLTFIVVNTDPNYQPDNPQTGDDIYLYVYLLGGSLIGIILLIISFIMNKKES